MSRKKDSAKALAKKHLEAAAHLRLPIDRIRPNTWNMNKMPPALRTKLVHGIKDLHAKTGRLPPIVVRPHPTEADCYQIIDGFHRWDGVRMEEIDTASDAFVLDVDTRTAMILTETLNYLRGEADPDLQVKFFQTLNNDLQMPVKEIAEFVPNTAEEITDLFDAYSIQVVNVEVPDTAPAQLNEGDDGYDEAWVEMKFTVSKSQMDVIEAELARIGSLLNGKNIRGRALEFMAVTSSQTDIVNLTGELPDEPIADSDDAKRRIKLRDMKAKLKAISAGDKARTAS